MKNLDTYLFGANSVFIEELYNKFLKDPNSVDSTWAEFFENLKDNKDIAFREFAGASWSKTKTKVIDDTPIAQAASSKVEASEDGLSTKIHSIIAAYRATGHMMADLDPLKLENKKIPKSLDYKHHEISDVDLEKTINIHGEILGIEQIKVSELINLLQNIYSKNAGLEFMHVKDIEQREWIRGEFEKIVTYDIEASEKKKILQDIIEIEGFEQFLHIKFPGDKRFSVEGGATSLNSLQTVIEQSAELGVNEVVVGMAHRGRLNVLTKIMGKSYHSMLSEFQGNLAHPADMDISGDVKYHLGWSEDKEYNGKKVHLSLAANPSHLEAVNPVVAGKVRCKQDLANDVERVSSMGILIHGDAAFAGQGVVAESLSLSDLEGYKTGGIMHIVINNQVGFTTSPNKARLSRYPTEFAKIIQAPIIHVNGDDPETVVKVSKIAANFRAKFKKDIVIDVVCYRLYGHNEGDEPFFTQPIMYKAISEHPTATNLYSEKLKQENVLSAEEFEGMKSKFRSYLDDELNKSKTFKPDHAEWLSGRWSEMKDSRNDTEERSTGIDKNQLEELGKSIIKLPEDFTVNSKIARQLEAKAKMIETGLGIDWGTGEALAFASILAENKNIRLSGQDAGRGTFSHRHSVLTDQNNENKYLPFNHLGENQGSYEVIDSNLSEYAVLGFEYGYSLVDPNNLVLWEGQFGDFANGAQIMIDQFISSAETKWLRMSGLVMLLPHGYEGQGPEHSSARLERFLQLCAEDNMIVANCTTPASYFHILRRQFARNYRKPLIIMTPKSLLRHKLATSKLDDMITDTKFRPVISETEKLIDDSKIRKLIIASGKVYYDLFEERQKSNVNDVAIIRLEQLYPFAEAEIIAELNKYSNAEIVWCQEEPKNMGAWSFFALSMNDLMSKHNLTKKISYAGRKAAASPAAGYKKIHTLEQNALIKDALK